MLRIALKNLAATKRRLVGTAFAVFLGVSFLAGTLALNDTLRASFDTLFTDVNAGTDVVVRNATELTVGGKGPTVRQRGLLEASLVGRIRDVDGVSEAVPTIEGSGQLLGADGRAVGGNGPPRVAEAWIDDPNLTPWRLVKGRAPRGDDEVIINRGAATAGHLDVGDTTTVLTPEPVRVTITGVATFGDTDGFGASTFTAFTLDGAVRHLTKDPTHISGVRVEAEPGISQAELARRIAAVMPSGVETMTGATLSRENIDEISGQFLNLLRGFLLVFAGIAVLVATLSIHNTFTIVVTQRSREAGLLRAIGASRRQLLALVAAEALAIGAVASAAGLVGGVALAGLLKGVLDSFGFALPAGGLVVTGSSVTVAWVVGLLATLTAAALPAVHASRTTPIAALREVAIDHSSASRPRIVVGVVVTVAGACVVIGGVAARDGAGTAGLGALLTIVGVVALGPVTAGPAAAVLGWPLARLRGVSGALARRNAMRNPRRTAATATALLLGVTVVVLFTVFASSLKTSMDRSMSRSIDADLVVASPTYGGAGLSLQLAQTLAALPSVERATGIGRGAASVDGTDRFVSVADPLSLEHVLDVDVASGALGALGQNGIAVSVRVASEHTWRLGSPVEISFADGARTRPTVAAIYRSNDLIGDYLLPRGTWAQHAPQDADSLVLVALRPDTDLDAARTAIEAATIPFGRPTVQDRDQFAKSATQGIDMMLGIVFVLLALAIVIALLGIANSLSLSTHERIREIGLLRAVGQTRRQVRTMVRAESLIIALFGTSGGVGLGLFFGWALVQAVGSETASFTIPGGQLATVVVLGSIAGILAGRRPARRAARLDVLQAIATDY
jgi:putative ABC transport system permease protein